MRTCLIDNYDSYTYNLFHVAAEAYDTAPTVIRNDDPELTASFLQGFDAVILSPGPGRPQRRADVGFSLEAVREARIPALGVCLGHQGLAYLGGASVGPAPHARHGHVSRVRHNGTGLFRGIPQELSVVRYHSHCVREPLHCVREPLPERVRVDAWSEDGVIMAFHDAYEPWWGVQFHPESVATEHGKLLLQNFADLIGGKRSTSLCAPRLVATAPPDQARISGESWQLVHAEIPGVLDPTWVFEQVAGDRPWSFWLDSSLVLRDHSRFSFIGFPGGSHGEILRYRAGEESTEVVSADDTPRGPERGSIFDVLSRRLRERELPIMPALPFDLIGGYVGYFGYELRAECGSPNMYKSPVPDAMLVSATRYVVLDHEGGSAWAVAVDPDAADEGSDARRWVSDMRDALAQQPARRAGPPSTLHGPGTEAVQYLRSSRGEYVRSVRACLEALNSGESYEICLTDEMVAPFDGDPLEFYLAQRLENPAPYAAFLRLNDVHILSSSPERFLRIYEDGLIESKPIKGTAPRRDDPLEDQDEARRLKSSSKTRAENLMIVDLVRNDLGRVSRIGSIEVPRLMEVESYATVHQLVSTIRGRLRPGIGAVEAVQACFPGGSMTGAPKLRTMEIIQDLERRARGPYAGTLGFLAATGAADLSIVIRTAIIARDEIRIGAGGAIVLDSDPEDEYEEMLLKLRAAIPNGGDATE